MLIFARHFNFLKAFFLSLIVHTLAASLFLSSEKTQHTSSKKFKSAQLISSHFLLKSGRKILQTTSSKKAPGTLQKAPGTLTKAEIQTGDAISDINQQSDASGPGSESSSQEFNKYFSTVRDIFLRELRNHQFFRQRKRGELIIRVIVQTKGILEDISIEESSGNSKLDEFTAKIIHDLGSIPPIPFNTNGDNIILRIPISFKNM